MKILRVFAISFVLNLVWENLHSFLYTNYMGGMISESVLINASLVDALITVLIVAPFIYSLRLKKSSILIIPIGIVVAILIEKWALATDRWAYNAFMPIIPILNVGLTPTIQLGLLGYCAYKLSDDKQRKLEVRN